jgi:hypothetical protein
MARAKKKEETLHFQRQLKAGERQERDIERGTQDSEGERERLTRQPNVHARRGRDCSRAEMAQKGKRQAPKPAAS